MLIFGLWSEIVLKCLFHDLTPEEVEIVKGGRVSKYECIRTYKIRNQGALPV